VPLLGHGPPEPGLGLLARADELRQVVEGLRRWKHGDEHPHATTVTAVDQPVDYRYLLANERTFLAYVRTALALQVAGLGVLQFLTHGTDAIRYALGLALVLAGSGLGLTGYRRFRANERAIRSGAEMPTARLTLALTLAIVVVPAAAAVGLAVASAR
jgi:putative membrane protein